MPGKTKLTEVSKACAKACSMRSAVMAWHEKKVIQRDITKFFKGVTVREVSVILRELHENIKEKIISDDQSRNEIYRWVSFRVGAPIDDGSYTSGELREALYLVGQKKISCRDQKKILHF